MTNEYHASKIYNNLGETDNYRGENCKNSVIFLSPAPLFLVNLYLRN